MLETVSPKLDILAATSEEAADGWRFILEHNFISMIPEAPAAKEEQCIVQRY